MQDHHEENHVLRTDQFTYHLPPEQIAQVPLERGDSRLLVLHRDTGRIEHRHFSNFPEYLHAGDSLVVNDTRVSARRLQARRDNGLTAEVLLLRPVGSTQWEALVQPGKSLKPGKQITLIGPAPDFAHLAAHIVEVTSEGGRLIQMESPEDRDTVAKWGSVPLPPYIRQEMLPEHEERYQTVYSRHVGSAAAPTAGLHFTEEMLTVLRAQGVHVIPVTLHVSVDTFRPVRTEIVGDHRMHGEWIEISKSSSDKINAATGKIFAIGTTSVRVLETAAFTPAEAMKCSRMRVVPYEGETRLFIAPGYSFKAVDALLTNFHLPNSTLLMLVCALGGYNAVMAAYAEAVAMKYRFFSFGDAMLII